MWRLLIHDLDKIYTKDHRRKNPHHWEYWDTGEGLVDMPAWAVGEMVADWVSQGIRVKGKFNGRTDKLIVKELLNVLSRM